ncbi:hypothetical protein [Ideonella sp. BN130291]|uniref:hypothetical protein n=1 Tax=Ideonella sp. BN130291 TaxID=3112940 RepID=UPI002E2534DA|nr:hypothetical protein [Ideonella sp. BN130291]
MAALLAGCASHDVSLVSPGAAHSGAAGSAEASAIALQRAGAREAAGRQQAIADRERAEAERDRSPLEWIIDSLFYSWLDSASTSKR